MRRSGGAVVLLVVGVACSPIKTAHAPVDAPAATAGAEAASGSEVTWIDVSNAEVERVGAGRRLTLTLSRAPETIRTRDMESPPRLLLRSEEHTSELQSRVDLVCLLLLEKKKEYE